MQYHLERQIEQLKADLRAHQKDPSAYHWQSIAVLLMHCKALDRLRSQLLRGLYTDGGCNEGYENVGPSLYLSPKGMPYYVDYAEHSSLVYGLFEVSQNQLDAAGWLHISGGRVDVCCRLTSAQKRWLEDNPNKHQDEGWGFKEIGDGYLGVPVRYEAAEKFDVRPCPEDDWEVMARRINMAAGAVPTQQPEIAFNTGVN